MKGQTLGGYQIESELGSGGMGTVWLATRGGARYALKVVHPHLIEAPGFFKRFLREAEVGQAVRHPNVVRTLDCDALDGHHFLVMEYVVGQTLRELYEELESVPEELCRHIGREVSKGLAAIHEAGVVHRDMKPENVLITPDYEVKIMDLGVARLADEAIRLSQTGAFVGSIHYAAPEQFRGGGEDLDGRADLHALGLILYELSSGHHPYLADDVAHVLRKVLNDEPRRLGEVNPQLSAFFEEVVHTLIAKDREQRFASAVQLGEALTQGEESTWWGQRARTLREETKRPLRRIRIPRETAVYGREDELATLRGLYEQAKAGEGQVVVIEGEAGIGKSRLVDELVARLHREGEDINFLFGSYPPGGAATAAGAWSTAYRQQFGADGSAAWLTETPILVPAFDALLRGEPPPEGRQPLTKDSLHTVFVHSSRALAAERSTIVLIEDLHFAPEEGRALFTALSRAVPGYRILLLGTARPGLPEEWRAHHGRMELARLGSKALGELLIDAFHSERLAEDLGFRIATKSDGNPFFVFEIIRGLREGQFIRRRADGTWVTTRVIEDIEVPSSVLDLVKVRVSGLSEEERDLLDIACCCGFEFDPILVSEAAGTGHIPGLKRLAQIERRHRLVRAVGSTYVFDHHQVQEALYESLADPLRQAYHATIGEALLCRDAEPRGARAVDVCEHLLNGARGVDALAHFDEALDHLEAGYLNDQALALADRALEEDGLLTGERRVGILLRKVPRLDLLGRRDLQRAALDEVHGLLKGEKAAGVRSRAHGLMGDLLFKQARYEEARESYRLARDAAMAIGDRKGEARAESGLGRVAERTGRPEDARARLERAVEIASDLGDLTGEASGEISRANLCLSLGKNEAAMEHYRRGLSVAREGRNRVLEGIAIGNMGVVLTNTGRYAEARESVERALGIVREIGDRAGEMRTALTLGNVLVALGSSLEALAQSDSALAIAVELGDRRSEGLALLCLGYAYRELGAYDEAKDSFERQLAIAVETGDGRDESLGLELLGIIYEEQGDRARAEEVLQESLRLSRKLERRFGMSHCSLYLGRLHMNENRLDEAEANLTEALGLAREIEAPGFIVLASALLAGLPGGDPSTAVSVYEEHATRLTAYDRMDAEYLLYRGTGDVVHLDEAHRLLGRFVEQAPDEYRESMLVTVPLYRDITAAHTEREAAP